MPVHTPIRIGNIPQKPWAKPLANVSILQRINPAAGFAILLFTELRFRSDGSPIGKAGGPCIDRQSLSLLLSVGDSRFVRTRRKTPLSWSA